MYEDKTAAEVIADSTWDRVRLVTMRATFPRFILAEFNTHRAFSRNSGSSRAIPVKRQIELVEESPFTPQRWPRNQAGMQAREYFPPESTEARVADVEWESARDYAVDSAQELMKRGIHKQIASRLLEPFMWHTVIVSSTMPGLGNFFAQRDHEDAQPEMQVLARAMRKALDESTPQKTWVHIPFHTDKGSDGCGTFEPESAFITAVARCARVSYGREMEEKTYEENAALVTRLIKGQHWSPFEHLAAANTDGTLSSAGNFSQPWAQLRHNIRRFLPSIRKGPNPDYLPTIAARIDSEHST